MKFRTLKKITESVFGRALLILSFVIPASYLVGHGFEIPLFKLSLSGSILLTITYAVLSASIPAIVEQFATAHEYANEMIRLSQLNCIDLESEFHLVEQSNIQVEKLVDDLYYDFQTISKTENELGHHATARFLSMLKYELANQSKNKLRNLLTVSLILGVFLLYAPIILKSIEVMSNGIFRY